MMSNVYDERFYDVQRATSYKSAQAVVPVLIELIQPNSIVDFGCGVGTWLTSFIENGIEDVLGLDGEWAPNHGLEISRSRFKVADLTTLLKFERTFDLAICLEVAEHLPQSAGATLVESLTQAAPVVVFSAAIPGQGGTNHINEQWQDFWVAEFSRFGYKPFDVIRPLIWRNSDVRFYYRQNILLFTKPDTNLLLQAPQDWTFNRIHEEAFKLKSEALDASTKIVERLNISSGKASIRVLNHAMKGISSAILRKVGFKL